MAKEAFQHRNFQAKTLDMIAKVNAVLEAATDEGYVYTLRQLHYQFVHNKWYLNTPQNYNRLIYIVDEGRKAGLIDWAAVEDRARGIMRIHNYRDPKDFMQQSIGQYAEALWSDQEYYCENWVEKDALVGVIERPSNKFRVPYMACRGYMSTSEQYAAGKRFAAQRKLGKKCVLFYLGDHDPSGVDMTRNNDENVNWFARSGAVEVRRLGLNMDQIEELDLAPDYAKEKDSRTKAYIERFETDESWELDALTPKFIDALVTAAITSLLDMPKFEAARAKEIANAELLAKATERWESVARFVKYGDVSVDVAHYPATHSGQSFNRVVRSADEILDRAEREDRGTDSKDA